MNINKILKDYNTGEKEMFKADFRAWLKYFSKKLGWGISDITYKNCEKKIPMLFYNEIKKLLKLDKELNCFFTDEHKYSSLLTDKRKKKYDHCLYEVFSLIMREFDAQYKKIADFLFEALDDCNEVMRYIFYKDIPLLVNEYEIDIDKCCTDYLRYYEEDPDNILSFTILDNILESEPENYKELCDLIYKTIDDFYSIKHWNEIKEELKNRE